MTETASSTSAVASEQAAQVASRASEGGRDVAATAGAGAQQVAGTVREQASVVTSTAASELNNLVRDARGRLRQQAERQTEQVADGLAQIGEQLRALAEGRTDGAGSLVGPARRAADQLDRMATRAREGGMDAMLGDVKRFARRRPGAFLAGAAVAGVVVGRILRSSRDTSADESGTPAIASDGFDAAPVGIAAPPTVPLSTGAVGPVPLAGEEPLPLPGEEEDAWLVDDTTTQVVPTVEPTEPTLVDPTPEPEPWVNREARPA